MSNTNGWCLRRGKNSNFTGTYLKGAMQKISSVVSEKRMFSKSHFVFGFNAHIGPFTALSDQQLVQNNKKACRQVNLRNMKLMLSIKSGGE